MSNLMYAKFSFLQYNQEDADEYKCAVRLEKYFDKELSRVGLVDETQFPKVWISEQHRILSQFLSFSGAKIEKAPGMRNERWFTDMEYRNRKF